jgi:hypothetical protein
VEARVSWPWGLLETSTAAPPILGATETHLGPFTLSRFYPKLQLLILLSSACLGSQSTIPQIRRKRNVVKQCDRRETFPLFSAVCSNGYSRPFKAPIIYLPKIKLIWQTQMHPVRNDCRWSIAYAGSPEFWYSLQGCRKHNLTRVCNICSFHGGDYQDCCLPRYDVVQSGRFLPTTSGHKPRGSYKRLVMIYQTTWEVTNKETVPLGLILTTNIQIRWFSSH